MKSGLWALFVAVLALVSCKHDTSLTLDQQIERALTNMAPTGDKSYFIFPEPGDYAAIPNQDPQNPITKAKVTLGRFLFFETGFGQKAKYREGQETYSCASCHLPERGFTPGRIQGIADGGIGYDANRVKMGSYQEEELDVQGTRALSVLNSAYVTNTFWNGQFGANDKNVGTEYAWDDNPIFQVNYNGFHGQECQHLEGVELHRMEVNEKLLDEYGYRPYFDAAFPDWAPEDRYSPKAASFALAAYLRTLFANEAPFQKWLKGDLNALTTDEKKGAVIFLTKANCTNCHKGPSFNSMEFHRLGTKDMYENPDALFTSESDPKNLGRGGFTGQPEDMRAFKVPQLYNVGDYYSYFHGSSKKSLKDVILFKLKAKSENPYVLNSELSPMFNPVNLTPAEREYLYLFLANGLRDPDLKRYMPESLPSGNCFPNNDPFSRVTLGCD